MISIYIKQNKTKQKALFYMRIKPFYYFIKHLINNQVNQLIFSFCFHHLTFRVYKSTNYIFLKNIIYIIKA